MNTPICDFIAGYIGKNGKRFHMPGHKGVSFLGCEGIDITEITGADSLYDAEGIIRESEENASTLFGYRTFYSTEGSSHAIRAMLALVCGYVGRKPLIWAGRNAHNAFLTVSALLDFDLAWLYSDNAGYLSCPITANTLERKLDAADILPDAVYLTSPDYLGNMADIGSLAEVCHKHGVLLLVDNAHGAYLRFLPHSLHPIDLGADISADSAHKTLPVLTGGAYLHLSERLSRISDREVKEALRLFGSTSPSYLILQSLDLANRYLAEEYRERQNAFLPRVEAMKKELAAVGYTLVGSEPFKLTVSAKDYGYNGRELAELLEKQGITAEFSDPDYLVLMLTPSNQQSDIAFLTDALKSIPRKEKINPEMPVFARPRVAMRMREAMLSPYETVPIEQARGRIRARASVSCPPAVPILVCGEIIDEKAIECFRYYGIERCNVVKNNITY